MTKPIAFRIYKYFAWPRGPSRLAAPCCYPTCGQDPVSLTERGLGEWVAVSDRHPLPSRIVLTGVSGAAVGDSLRDGEGQRRGVGARRRRRRGLQVERADDVD